MGIFRDLLESNISPKELKNIKLFKQSVENFLDPILYHFAELDQEEIDSYRGAGGTSQKSREVRKILTRVIRDANIGFRSIWLDNVEESPDDKDKFRKEKEGLSYYLEREEDHSLEFKGSISLDLKRYFLGGKNKLTVKKSLADEGVLKSVVGFLNTKGGEVIIGMLEKSRFDSVKDTSKLNEFPIYGNNILIGIEIEYGKYDWDGYLQKLTNLIESKISTDVFDADLIKIEKLEFADQAFCLIKIKSSEGKQHLNNKDFYIRRTNKTILLIGPEIDNYWKKSRGKLKA